MNASSRPVSANSLSGSRPNKLLRRRRTPFALSALLVVAVLTLTIGGTGCSRKSAPPPKAASAPLAARNSKSENRHAFYLRDGDRVVFYGDSITEQRLYTTYIETFCVTRFPNRRFTFITSGRAGDRVNGGGSGRIDVRLRRDVIAYRPTVVTICLGMNDGNYAPFDQRRFDRFVRGYRYILDTLKRDLPEARLTLISPPAYDDVTQAPQFPGGYNRVLRTHYSRVVAALAKEYGHTFVDVNTPLVTVLEKAIRSAPKLAGQIILGRVHPGRSGHLVMAAAVLQAWNAPGTVAEVEIQAKTRKVRAVGAKIADLREEAGRLAFVQTDSALPWPFDYDPQRFPEISLVLRLTNLERHLNHYRLKVTGLPARRYRLLVDGEPLGIFPRAALAAGIHPLESPRHPANRQAQEVLTLTVRHNDLHFKRWREVQAPGNSSSEIVTPEQQRQMDALDAEERAVVEQQIAAAQPRPRRVELVPEGSYRERRNAM